MTKLTIELVPKTSWFTNLRSILKKEDWDNLRKQTYKKAHYRCEICGGRGRKWPVECHEIWEYDDEKKIQRLKKLIALCPTCHKVKHIGFASTQNRGTMAAKHLAKINNWTKQDTDLYIEASFETWSQRSQFSWQIDLTYLSQFNIAVLEYANFLNNPK